MTHTKHKNRIEGKTYDEWHLLMMQERDPNKRLEYAEKCLELSNSDWENGLEEIVKKHNNIKTGHDLRGTEQKSERIFTPSFEKFDEAAVHLRYGRNDEAQESFDKFHETLMDDFDKEVARLDKQEKEKTKPSVEFTPNPPGVSTFPLSHERTVYDPTKGGFITSTQRPLPNVKSWINKNDPSTYWFVICINNKSNQPIDEWGIELETPSTLKITETKIEGIEQKFSPRESLSKPWLTSWILGIPHHLGIVIPRKGSKRIYFKLGSEACGIAYTINGIVSTPDGEIHLKEKYFKYSCDVNTLDTAIVTDPKGAKNLVSSVIRSYYTEKEAVRIIDSFEMIIAISNLDDKTRADDLKSKLKQLKSLIFEEPLLNKIDEFYRRAEEELFSSGYLDSNYMRRTKRFCEEFIKDWKGEFLR